MNNGIFEGGFRRLPEQNLAGASRQMGKCDFMQKIHAERANRQLDLKKNLCVIKIQAVIRGFLARRRLKKLWKEFLLSGYANSIENGLTILDLGRLIAAYHSLNTHEYSEILFWLTKLSIDFHTEIIKLFTVLESSWIWYIKWLLKIHINRFRVSLPSKKNSESLVSELSYQLLEIFTNHRIFCSLVDESMATLCLKQILLYIVSNGYFYAVSDILHFDTSLPVSVWNKSDLISFVQDLISRPLVLPDYYKSKYMPTVIKEMCQCFLSNKITDKIQNFVFPIALNLHYDNVLHITELLTHHDLKPSASCLLVHVEYFKKGYFFSCQENFSKVLAAFSILLDHCAMYCPKVNSDSYFDDEPILDNETVDDDEDEDEDDDSFTDILEVTPVTDVNVEMVKNCIKYLRSIEFSMNVLNYLESLNSEHGYEVHILIKLSQFLQVIITKHSYVHFKILWYVSLHPTISRDIWLILYTMQRVVPQEKALLLINLVSKGVLLTEKEASKFYPCLITFCFIFKRHICMLYRDEKFNDSKQDFPFPIEKMHEISHKLRDLAISMLNIGLPNAPLLTSAELQACNLSKMKDCYQVIINLLRVLHSHEIGYDQTFWCSRRILPPSLNALNETSFLSKHVPFDEKCIRDRSVIATNNAAKSFIVLRDMPFCIPTKERMNLLQELILSFKSQFQNPNDFITENKFIKIRRDYIYEDAFEKLSLNEIPEIRINLRIQLTSSMGYEEIGVDGGGLFREFMTDFLKAAFDPNRGFFLLNNDRQLYPNPNAEVLYKDYKMHYFFIGRMLAKALYENILVDLPLANCFISSLIKRDKDVNLEDLYSLDPELYKNLISLRHYDGDFSNLALNYTAASDLYGQIKVTELIPGGERVSVNKNNKIDYIQTIADFKLNTQIEPQCSFFRQGIASVFSIFWLAIFSPKELQKVIFCSDNPIDVEDLKKHCYYTGGYTSEHPNIIRFWNVFEAFENDEKKQLLKFVTSCSRQPLLGFKDLDPPFTIHLVESSDRLPTSSTCMNLLKLPIFQDEDVMKEKLLYSIQYQAGFDLC